MSVSETSHSVSLTANAQPGGPQQLALADALLTCNELRTLLATIVTLASSGAAMLGPESVRECPKMLTAEEFAARYGDDPKYPTVATVERWCRDGELPWARDLGKAGWRIPEFHLWSTEPPAPYRWAYEGLTPRPRRGANAPAAPADAGAVTRDDIPVATPAEAAVDAERAARLTSDGFDPDDLDACLAVLASRQANGAAALNAVEREPIPSKTNAAGKPRKEARRSSA